MFSFPSVTHWQGELYPSSVCQQWTIRPTLSYNPYGTEHLLPGHFCRVWKPSLALQLLWVAGRRHLPHRFPVDLHLPVPLHAHLPSTGARCFSPGASICAQTWGLFLAGGHIAVQQWEPGQCQGWFVIGWWFWPDNIICVGRCSRVRIRARHRRRNTVFCSYLCFLL